MEYEYTFVLDTNALAQLIFQNIGVFIESTSWDGKKLKLRIKADLTSNQITTLEAAVKQQLPHFKSIGKKAVVKTEQ